MERDKKFIVEIDEDASSPRPDVAIWRGQKACVSETFNMECKVPSNCSDIIIRKQLGPKHFSVLRKAFVSFCCSGFPHSVIAQITRHQDAGHLVQSFRYTGENFIKVHLHEISLDDVFYMRPVGQHSSRNGTYTRTQEMNDLRIEHIKEACRIYNEEIKAGVPFEDARDIMPYGYRQNFDLSGDLQAIWHILDQRTLEDSQAEIRVLAEMILECLDKWCPELTAWYRKHRYKKNLLAP
jgi:thymidylate synthase (FAD)